MLNKGSVLIIVLFLLVFSALTTANATAPHGEEWCCFYETCNFFTCSVRPWANFALNILLFLLVALIVAIAVRCIKKRNKV